MGINNASYGSDKTLAFWQQMIDAEIISWAFCLSLITVFKLIAVTTMGGISTVYFEDDGISMSLGESILTSNLHQLTCVSNQELESLSVNKASHWKKTIQINLTRWAAGEEEKLDTDNHEGPFIFLLTRKSSKALHNIIKFSFLFLRWINALKQ